MLEGKRLIKKVAVRKTSSEHFNGMEEFASKERPT
jgi:hypothetical protein